MTARDDVASLWSEGRYVEAFALLDERLREAPDHATLHADAATLRAEMFDAPRAAHHAERALALASADLSLALRVAAALLRVGLRDQARTALLKVARANREPTPAMQRDLAMLLRDAGEYAAADARLAQLPDEPGCLAVRAELALWRGDVPAVLAFADALRARGLADVAMTLEGGARALQGELDGALGLLREAVARRPDDPTTAVWLGDTLRRAGHADEALRETRRGGERGDDLGEYVAAQLVIHLASLQRKEFLGPPDVTLAAAVRELQGFGVLPPSPPPPGPLPEDLRPTLSRRASVLEDAMERLRGNRSPTPTFVDKRGALRPLVVPPSPRTEAKRALWRFVASGDPEEALRVFDDIHRRWPDTPEPYNYRGELYLYLGDPALARAQFEKALARYRQSRWAYIGLGGAAVLEGRFEDALQHLADGVTLAGGPGPTTFVYRGEALRRLGRTAEAREDLTRSVALNPERVGAWVNLALLELDAGDLGAAGRAREELARRAPGFVRDAGDGEPREQLARMLAMLRGNRGSSCVTYFTRDGVLRSVRARRG